MLPYTGEVLFNLHARYLAETWPLALPVLLLTLAMGVPAARGGGARAAGLLLAAGWLWVGAVFHFNYFATINFAAPLYGGLFILQGLLLLWQGPVRGGLGLARPRHGAGWTGAALMVAAVIAYPLVDQLTASPGTGLRLAGLAPGPTALLTLGALLMTAGRTPVHLLVLPLLWAGVAGYSGWVLGLPADLLAAPLAVAAVVVALWRNHRMGSRTR